MAMVNPPTAPIDWAMEMPLSDRGEPTWEVALLFPRQGHWSSAQFDGFGFGREVKFDDGCLKFKGSLAENLGRRSRRGDPVWEVAYRFPKQGDWSEHDYMELETNWFVELVHGKLEFLPMPPYSHQDLVDYLHSRLKAFVHEHELGRTYFAPLRVPTIPGCWREPDVMFLAKDRQDHPDYLGDYPDGADLVIEIVSPGKKNRERDHSEKRAEYAQAGFPEYWIVDSIEQGVTVLTLPDGADEYSVHGEFSTGVATSKLLARFEIDVDELWNAAGGNPA